MRFLITISLLLFFSVNSAQTLEPNQEKTPQEWYDFHIQKKIANNTAGWITLGAGTAMILGGFGWNTSGGILDDDPNNNNKGLWLSYLGGAVTAISIPLFISAGSHKRKAKVYLTQGAVGFHNALEVMSVGLTLSF